MAGVRSRFKPHPVHGKWPIQFYITEQEAESIDQARGALSRGAFAKEATMRYAQVLVNLNTMFHQAVEQGIMTDLQADTLLEEVAQAIAS